MSTQAQREAQDARMLDLLYGELPPAEAKALRAQIAADPELQARFEGWNAVRMAAAALPEPEPDPQVHYDILRAARAAAAQPEKKSWWVWLSGLAMNPAFAAVGLVVIAAGTLAIYSQSQEQPDAASGRFEETLKTPDAPPKSVSEDELEEKVVVEEGEDRTAAPGTRGFGLDGRFGGEAEKTGDAKSKGQLIGRGEGKPKAEEPEPEASKADPDPVGGAPAKRASADRAKVAATPLGRSADAKLGTRSTRGAKARSRRPAPQRARVTEKKKAEARNNAGREDNKDKAPARFSAVVDSGPAAPRAAKPTVTLAVPEPPPPADPKPFPAEAEDQEAADQDLVDRTVQADAPVEAAAAIEQAPAPLADAEARIVAGSGVDTNVDEDDDGQGDYNVGDDDQAAQRKFAQKVEEKVAGADGSAAAGDSLSAGVGDRAEPPPSAGPAQGGAGIAPGSPTVPDDGDAPASVRQPETVQRSAGSPSVANRSDQETERRRVVPALLTQARAAQRRGDHRQAIQAFGEYQASYRSHDQFSRSLFEAARSYEALGDVGRALQLYKLVRRSEDPQIWREAQKRIAAIQTVKKRRPKRKAAKKLKLDFEDAFEAEAPAPTPEAPSPAPPNADE